MCVFERNMCVAALIKSARLDFHLLDFMRYGLAQEKDEAHSGRNPRWLTGPVSQSSAVKSTLPMGYITSYVIVGGPKVLYYRDRSTSKIATFTQIIM
ncbi:hypothetical protein ElyMa_005467000 [Elysia marginata]|uniref:Uncharacterized protein n=1 Tax=Elysia marginata TaxID=1093978 RepID=A0AAV4EQB9_9GAST|nr:hypothetical protein ElyMa_005467000 [Elysia marginata]